MTLASVIRGSGPPVIALHGGPGLSHRYLRRPLAPLEAERTVHYVDHLGHGESRRRGPYTFASLAESVIDYAYTHASGGSAILGHSMGGAIAIGAATREPHLFRSLVLVSTNVRRPPILAGGHFGQKAAVARAAARHAVGPGSREQRLAEVIRACGGLLAHHNREAVIEEVVASIVPPLDCVLPLLGSFLTLDIRPVLGKVQVPTLILTGSEDHVSGRDARILENAIPGAVLRVIPGVGHNAILEAPDAVVARVLPFLRRVGTAAVDRPADEASATRRAGAGFRRGRPW